MTKTTANPQVAEIGRDPVTRPGRRDGLRNNLRNGLAGIMGRISTKARWIISAAVGLITPAVLIAESAAAPIADALACFGNGSFMALAATANAFTMIP
jgi:hypothetical protein